MNWELFWIATGVVVAVVVPLVGVIVGCFKATSKDLRAIAERLSHLEGYIAGRDVGSREHYPKTGTDNKDK